MSSDFPSRVTPLIFLAPELLNIVLDLTFDLFLGHLVALGLSVRRRIVFCFRFGFSIVHDVEELWGEKDQGGTRKPSDIAEYFEALPESGRVKAPRSKHPVPVPMRNP
jgi:hypothetical protein